jgi:hypothetical protein
VGWLHSQSNQLWAFGLGATYFGNAPCPGALPYTELAVFFLIGESLQNFDLKNVISTNTKDFSWKKWK